MRIPHNATVNATTAKEEQLRLFVDPTSRLLLQVALGIIWVLVIIAMSLPDGVKALRTCVMHNPATVAGQLALFAGTRIVRDGMRVEDVRKVAGAKLKYWEVDGRKLWRVDVREGNERDR